MIENITGFVRPSKNNIYDLYRSCLDTDGVFQKKLGKYKGKVVSITIEETNSVINEFNCTSCKRHSATMDMVDTCDGVPIVNAQWASIRHIGCPAWRNKKRGTQ